MTRDSFGVIEMERLTVKLPLELDDILLLVLAEELIDGMDVGTALPVGETETVTAQSSEFGPAQVTHEGWQS